MLRMDRKYTVIAWDDKDDIQKLLDALESDAELVLNDALQFKYVLELFDEHLDFINKAPCFWRGVITSLKYSMLMQAHDCLMRVKMLLELERY